MIDSNKLTISNYFQAPNVKKKFEDVLGSKAPAFIASMLSAISTNSQLANADPKSVYSAAMIAASLDLPINPNLGMAYIIPYNVKDKTIEIRNNKEVAVEKWVVKGQFQVGWKGFVQLALRTNQYETINTLMVKEGEIVEDDLLSGEMKFNWIKDRDERDKAPNIGAVAYFRLLNGFYKYNFMTINQLIAHGLKYSKTYSSKVESIKKSSKWETDFEAMAKKTVLKLLLDKFGPKSTQMQTAQLADQAVIKENGEMEYPDNEKQTSQDIAKDKERNRIITHINESTSIIQLNLCQDALNGDKELEDLFTEKYNSLTEKAK